MERISSHIFLILLAVLLFGAVSAMAQDPQPSAPPKQQLAPAADQDRPNLLGELGLSREQIQQLRIMNLERRPIVEAANKRMREANRALDQVIYGDAVDEGEFRVRLKEFQDAQAEVTMVRFENELALRRILTPDQLIKFREVRQRFAEARKARNAEIKALNKQNRPFQNIRPAVPLNRNQPPRKLP